LTTTVVSVPGFISSSNLAGETAMLPVGVGVLVAEICAATASGKHNNSANI
jgi:hypothetical protein